MTGSINKEHRVIERHWKQREKEIERVVKNTVGLYGDMQVIIGGQIPEISTLELDGDDTRQLPDSQWFWQMEGNNTELDTEIAAEK